MKKINFALLGVCMLFVSWLLPSTMTAQGEIKVTVGESGKFVVEGLKGDNISVLVNGSAPNFQINQGWDNPKKKIVFSEDYNVGKGAVVLFKGDVSALRLTSGDVVELDASKASASFKTLVLKELKINKLILSKSNSLTAFSLIDNADHLKVLDLKAQTELKTLFLGNFNGKNNIFDEVLLPTPNVLESIDFSRTAVKKVDLNNLPKLKKFIGTAMGYHEKPITLDASSNLVVFWVDRARIENVILKNKPNLKWFMIQALNSRTFTKLHIENAPKLVEYTDELVKKGGLYLNYRPEKDEPYVNIKTLILKKTGVRNLKPSWFNGFPNLRRLDVRYSPVEHLDLTTTPKLKAIKCSFEKLSYIKVFKTKNHKKILAKLVDKIINADQFDGIVPKIKVVDRTQARSLSSSFRATDEGNDNDDDDDDDGWDDDDDDDNGDDDKDDDTDWSDIYDKAKKKGWNVEENGSTTALEGLASASVRIYPTQTKDLVKIEGAKANMPYAVYAVSGKLCEKGMTGSFGSAEIHLNTYAKGVYLVKLGAKSQKIVLR